MQVCQVYSDGSPLDLWTPTLHVLATMVLWYEEPSQTQVQTPKEVFNLLILEVHPLLANQEHESNVQPYDHKSCMLPAYEKVRWLKCTRMD